MKRHYFQRFMLAVLAVALMAASAQAAPMTSAEKESIYSSAILNLETYIESYGESDISLTGIEEAFSGLGRYEQSASLLSYTKILEKLQNDTYDYELMLQLHMLDKDAKFKGYLAETLKGSAIGSVEELTLYASGREHEYNQQLEAAIADYEKCLSFFDANIRYFSLQSGQDKAAYERANALLAAADFAGAYYAFGRTNRYQDSESRRAAIADMIGYVPASETDNPEPVTKLTAEATATEIRLVWNKAKHATGYQVAYRQDEEPNWHAIDCGIITSYTLSGLIPDTDYEFSVIARAGKVKTEAHVVDTKTEKILTPTPTVVPSPTPNTTSTISIVKKGSYITFGHYPQTAAGNDSTPIEWLVLEVKGNQALLISRYGLDAQPYNKERTEVTWETCTIRTWLNGTFLNKAFSASERKAIVTTDVDNSQNQGYRGWSTNGGNNTQDKVFLLSYADAYKYFGVQLNGVIGAEKNAKSQVAPTAYAIRQGAYTIGFYETSEGTAAGRWWLRSPGYYQLHAAYISFIGTLYYNDVSLDSAVVRPALWVNLASDIF